MNKYTNLHPRNQPVAISQRPTFNSAHTLVNTHQQQLVTTEQVSNFTKVWVLPFALARLIFKVQKDQVEEISDLKYRCEYRES